MEKIEIHNRNYKVRPEVKKYIASLEAENRNLKAALKSKHPNTCPLCECECEWENNKTGELDVCPCCDGMGTV